MVPKDAERRSMTGDRNELVSDADRERPCQRCALGEERRTSSTSVLESARARSASSMPHVLVFPLMLNRIGLDVAIRGCRSGHLPCGWWLIPGRRFIPPVFSCQGFPGAPSPKPTRDL